VILVILLTVAAGVGIGEAIQLLGSKALAIVAGVLASVALGFLMTLGFHRISAPLAPVVLFPGVWGIGRGVINVCYPAEPGLRPLWPEILSVFVVLPAILGAFTYCWWAKDWTAMTWPTANDEAKQPSDTA
jgi:hypothetical protein